MEIWVTVILGINEKICNIEATEAAKKRAAEERISKAMSGAPNEFVPTNLAVNFWQTNSFKQMDAQTDEQTNKQTERQKKNKQKKCEVKYAANPSVKKAPHKSCAKKQDSDFNQ